MKDICLYAVDTATERGAEFADVRILVTRREDIVVRNDRVATLEQGEEAGVGVRVIFDGAWGFSATKERTKEAIQRTVDDAINIAKASSLLKQREIILAPEPTHIAFWETPVQIDPFNVPLDQKVETLRQCTQIMHRFPKIKVALGWMSFQRKHQWFANSEGTQIEQILTRSGAGIQANATDGSELQTRSYPQSHGGQFMGTGYELVNELQLIANAEQIADEAQALLKADPCPEGEFDLILDGSQIALQIHESVGHALELDRVLGAEANYAGTSFASLEKLNNFQYGSEIVNIVADATSTKGLATFGYDDEGVQSQSWHLIKDGILVGYLTSRETAYMIDKQRSQGCMRADGWQNLPIIRMVNISLMPQQGTLDELLSDTGNGIFMAVNRSWSIDNKRVQFQFGCEIAWEIKGGKKVRLLKNPCYAGITWDFWRSCDTICGKNEWMLWGVPNCGKGQPPQRAEMSHGAAPARFRKIKVFASS